MSLLDPLIPAAIRAVESTPLPDFVTRAGIRHLVGMRRRALAGAADQTPAFARAMAAFPIAQHTEAANDQHYELPPRFFALTLGARRKYSSCLYPAGTETLDQAEVIALDETMAHALLARVRGWIAPHGRLFVHVFTHRSQPYRFDTSDPTDWIAQHFFTGGIMPSHGLIAQFPDLFAVEAQWRWSGEHYARTARDWLARFDANRAEIDALLADVYGADARLWARRWRLFYLATEGLFGHAGGSEWGVSHYRLAPA
eukprot:gene14735-14862_t